MVSLIVKSKEFTNQNFGIPGAAEICCIMAFKA
ncbi:hypothetical protein SAMN05444000_14212 [Shimia gijangensis]|uniref:Uncharacterized protein n=1 Tax=Shimia gijangensis TaxID=1470563 RepID=A0A1M6TNN0_9RHOB|nr:hypothetical protein SAMN05444000_14212 [Shimia gijangensis]